VGQAVTFMVTATSSEPLSYQWQKGGENIDGALSPTFSIASPLVTDAGSYSVVVTNGGGSAISDAAMLTVSPATPEITAVPVAAAIRCGQTLAEATLTGGAASVPGTFAFASPTTVPDAGTANQAVIFTPADPANYTLAIIEVGVTVTDGFLSWIGGFAGLEGQINPGDDPDGDGIANLMEYVLAGGDPERCDRGILPMSWIMNDGNRNYLALTVRKKPAAGGVSCMVESSGNLADWNAGSGHTVVVSETADTLIVRDSKAMDAASQRFLRLKVVSGQP
jgi:hypothetical protein